MNLDRRFLVLTVAITESSTNVYSERSRTVAPAPSVSSPEPVDPGKSTALIIFRNDDLLIYSVEVTNGGRGISPVTSTGLTSMNFDFALEPPS